MSEPMVIDGEGAEVPVQPVEVVYNSQKDKSAGTTPAEDKGASEPMDHTLAPSSEDHVMETSDTSAPALTNGHTYSDKRESEEKETNISVVTNGAPSPSPSASQLSSSTPGHEDEEIAEQLRGIDNGSGSPPLDNATEKDQIRTEKEVIRLEKVLSEVSPEAAQKVLKQNWRKFLFEGYNEEHISFLFRCLIKNSSSEVLEKLVEGGGLLKGALLSAAVDNGLVVSKVLRDSTLEQILKYVPKPLLTKAYAVRLEPGDAKVQDDAAFDKAFHERIRTATAKTLLGWLAQHERLGFERDDCVDPETEEVSPNPDRVEDVDMNQRGNHPPPPQPNGFHPGPPPQLPQGAMPPGMIPPGAMPPVTFPPPRMPPPPMLGQSPQNDQQSSNADNGNSRYVCPHCHSQFMSQSGHNYHIHKRICEKEPPVGGWKWVCTYCLQGFTTKQGREYHNLKGVCEDCKILPAVSVVTAAPVPQPTPTPTIVRPQMQQRSNNNSPAVSRPSNPPTPAPAPASTPSANTQTPVTSSQPRAPPAAIPRPPLHTPTPTRKQSVNPSDIRQSPSELPPDRREALDREIEEEDRRYEAAKDEATNLPEEEQAARLISLKNGNASKKSTIRKKYGVSLRLREKDKQAAKGRTDTPPKSRLGSYMATASSAVSGSAPAVRPTSAPITVPVVSGFSPINATRRPNPTPQQNGYHSSPYGPAPSAHISPYGNGPPASSSRAQVSVQPHASVGDAGNEQGPSPPNAHAYGGSRHSNPRYAPQNQMTTSSYAERYPNKRRRSDDDSSARPSPQPPTHHPASFQGPSGGYQTPYAPPPAQARSSSVQSTSKNAPDTLVKVIKMPKKMLKGAQSRWEALHPKNTSNSNSPTSPKDKETPDSGTAEPDGDITMRDTTSPTPANNSDTVLPSTEPKENQATGGRVISISSDEEDEADN